jgi:phage shock protein C
MIAGVAGGVAENLDTDPSIIRIIWAVLIVLTGGLALLVYVVMAIVVPYRPDGMPYTPAADQSDAPASTGSTGSPAPAPGGWVGPDGSTVPLGAAPTSRRPGRDRDDRARAGLIGGVVLIGLGGFFLVRQFLPALDLGFWWPTVAIGLGVLLVVVALLPSRRSG